MDEETQRLNLLERKIRRPRLASSDAEEISEDLDVSHHNNTLQIRRMLYYDPKCQHSPYENIFYAQYLLLNSYLPDCVSSFVSQLVFSGVFDMFYH